MNKLLFKKKLMKSFIINILFFLLLNPGVQAQAVKIALAKYNGGGDWYANPTSLPNLIKFCNSNMKTNINPEPSDVEVGNQDLFNFPFVHMTGHGNVVFSVNDAQNLRKYLEGGGFLHIDDNYGLNEFIRREMKKVFPDRDFTELPPSHPVFHQKYDFPDGLPKIHEHDKKQPQAFGIFIGDRLVCLFTYESDLGDGWEDPDVHSDSEEIRLKALKMGANIISFVFNQ
jgi:hypothetical protein